MLQIFSRNVLVGRCLTISRCRSLTISQTNCRQKVKDESKIGLQIREEVGSQVME